MATKDTFIHIKDLQGKITSIPIADIDDIEALEQDVDSLQTSVSQVEQNITQVNENIEQVNETIQEINAGFAPIHMVVNFPEVSAMKDGAVYFTVNRDTSAIVGIAIPGQAITGSYV